MTRVNLQGRLSQAACNELTGDPEVSIVGYYVTCMCSDQGSLMGFVAVFVVVHTICVFSTDNGIYGYRIIIVIYTT